MAAVQHQGPEHQAPAPGQSTTKVPGPESPAASTGPRPDDKFLSLAVVVAALGDTTGLLDLSEEGMRRLGELFPPVPEGEPDPLFGAVANALHKISSDMEAAESSRATITAPAPGTQEHRRSSAGPATGTDHRSSTVVRPGRRTGDRPRTKYTWKGPWEERDRP